MATPCNPELVQSPFQTYRDPATGEWSVVQDLAEAKPSTTKSSNVISLAAKRQRNQIKDRLASEQ